MLKIDDMYKFRESYKFREWCAHAGILGLLTFFAYSRPLIYNWSIGKSGEIAIELKIIIFNLFIRFKNNNSVTFDC